VDIVTSSECPGGQPYTRSIAGRFFLPRKSSSMLVYLKKETRFDEEKKPEKPAGTFHYAYISPVEDNVKKLGSVEAVFNYQGWESNHSVRDYARAFAEWYYWKPDLSKSPFRHGSVVFPSYPDKDVPLTINVEMRPASGLARVEFLPKKEAALKGRPVAFDYSRMTPVAEEDLPEPQLRWPETLHFETTSNPNAFDDHRIHDFIQLPPDASDRIFISHLDAMKTAICIPVLDSQGRFSIKKIDENGNAGSQQGRAVVSQLANRIEQQAAKFLESRWTWMRDNARIFLIRSSWLWAATPKNAVEYIEGYLASHRYNYDQTWNHIIESASRCFTSESQFKIPVSKYIIGHLEVEAIPFQYSLCVHWPEYCHAENTVGVVLIRIWLVTFLTARQMQFILRLNLAI